MNRTEKSVAEIRTSQSSLEQTSPDKIPPTRFPPGQYQTGHFPFRPVPPDQIPSARFPSAQIPPGKHAPGQVSPGDILLPTVLPNVQVLELSERSQMGLDKVPGMEAACVMGDVEAVHELHWRWLASAKPRENGGFFVRPWLRGAIGRAIENDHAELLSYLLSNGYRMEKYLVSSDIARAVQVRSTACLEAFLNRGWDINEATDPLYPSALRYALDDREMLEWFLAKKASPNAVALRDRTPLSHACIWASLDTIKFLFERGGSVEHGQLLHIAADVPRLDQVELLEFLLSKGAPINAIEFERYPDIYWAEYWRGLGTPLHYAAERGNLDAVRFLLSRGADPSIKDSRDHGRLARDRAQETLNRVRLTGQKAPSPTQSQIPSSPQRRYSPRKYPPEEDMVEIIRLLQPPWWTGLVPQSHFTDGKRFSFHD